MNGKKKSLTEVITVEKAAEIFRRNGIELTTSETAKILHFMQEMAKLVINQYGKDHEDS